ncbi:MAG: PAS domain S-box protein [Thermoleophilaceae bacterium]
MTEFKAPPRRASFGYTRGRALGREVARLLIRPPEGRVRDQTFAPRVQRRPARSRTERVELPMRRSNGSEVPVELTVTTTDGAPRSFVGFIRDLSSQHEAVGAARISEERYRRIVETSRRASGRSITKAAPLWSTRRWRRCWADEPADMMGREPFRVHGRRGRRPGSGRDGFLRGLPAAGGRGALPGIATARTSGW